MIAALGKKNYFLLNKTQILRRNRRSLPCMAQRTHPPTLDSPPLFLYPHLTSPEAERFWSYGPSHGSPPVSALRPQVFLCFGFNTAAPIWGQTTGVGHV